VGLTFNRKRDLTEVVVVGGNHLFLHSSRWSSKDLWLGEGEQNTFGGGGISGGEGGGGGLILSQKATLLSGGPCRGRHLVAST